MANSHYLRDIQHLSHLIDSAARLRNSDDVVLSVNVDHNGNVIDKVTQNKHVSYPRYHATYEDVSRKPRYQTSSQDTIYIPHISEPNVTNIPINIATPRADYKVFPRMEAVESKPNLSVNNL